MTSPTPERDHDTTPAETAAWVTGEDLEPGDAYREGEFVVFTAQFHLRRGFCCNSGCRHCPYHET